MGMINGNGIYFESQTYFEFDTFTQLKLVKPISILLKNLFFKKNS
jgi:hypothetical protein